jgi:hypothetical protein
MAIVIASPRAESWGVAGVVRPGFCVSFILSKNRGKINHAEAGDFPRSYRSFGQSVRGSKARTSERCLIVAWPHSTTYGKRPSRPTPDATTEASLIEMLTYCRARA